MERSRRPGAMPRAINFLLQITSLVAFIVPSTRAFMGAPGFDYGGESSFEQDQQPVLLNSLGLVASSSSSSGSTSIQCEPITVGLCAGMAYESTRMPNFFKDPSQIEAADRALQYMDLVSSKCSPHVHAYICELLAPVCLTAGSQEAMRRFDIYPCRSFCRRVKRDCEHELIRLSERLFGRGTSLLPAFACDQLPFETNGGNASSAGSTWQQAHGQAPRGPCHEMPEAAPTNPTPGGGQGQNQPSQSQKQQETNSSYRPYQGNLDFNVPPFITDTSRLDASIIGRPQPELSTVGRFQPNNGEQQQADLGSNMSNMKAQARPAEGGSKGRLGQPTSQQQQQPGLPSQLNSFGQSTLWFLMRYSNLISIACCVLLLLLALNSKRLHRLKSLLSSSPSSSSSSKSSTASSQQKLQLGAGGAKLACAAGFGSLAGRAPNCGQVSPSASSRSLVLIAGHKQAPSHQLMSSSNNKDFIPVSREKVPGECQPSQELLHGLSHRTLVNLNGTLDRQQRHNRYLIMQSTGERCHHGAGLKATSDEQRLFSTLDSQSSSGQYDYIQVGPPAAAAPGSGTESAASGSATAAERWARQQQQRQLYSNILLSSPSHQVLLYDGQQQQQQHKSAASPRQPSHYYASSAASSQLQQQLHTSPYASPCEQKQQSPLLGAKEMQRSFQRARKGSWGARAAPRFCARTAGSGLAGSGSSAASSSSRSSALEHLGQQQARMAAPPPGDLRCDDDC